MSFYKILIFSFLLLDLFSCEDKENIVSGEYNTNQDEVIGEKQKLRERNNKLFKEKVDEYLKEMNLSNKKTITKEEFKKIFKKLFEFGAGEVKKEEGELKNDINNNKYIDKVFNNLVQEQEEIEVDKIIDFFEPKKILFSLKDSLNSDELNKDVESLSESLMHAFDSFDEQIIKKEKENNRHTDL